MRRWGGPAALAVTVVALDHLTKWWAQRTLDDHDIDLVWTLRLHLTYNNGAAFGVGSKYSPLIALAALTLVIVILGTSRTLGATLPRIGAALVVGGATGNLLDRLFRDGTGFLGGAVVDWIDLQWWPVFNLADSCIFIGAFVLALTAVEAEPS